MFQKAMKELRGDHVIARYGCIGAVDDLYFDRDCWDVRYLVLNDVTAQHTPRLLVSVACVTGATPQRDRLLVNLSRAQVECGAGAWPVEDASRWLSKARVCSSRAVVGMAVEAEDGAAGRVADLLVDDELWSIDYILVDTLPAAGGRQLLVPLDWVRLIDCEHGSVHLRCTRRELDRSPPF